MIKPNKPKKYEIVKSEKNNEEYENQNNIINEPNINIRIKNLSKENRQKIYDRENESYKLNYFMQNTYHKLPTEYKEDNSLKYMLRFHGGENNIKTDNFQIPENFYIISLEKAGLTYSSEIINYLYLRMAMLNNLSPIFFENITKELLAIEKKKIKKINNTYNLNQIEEKKFKIYYPMQEFHNYTITTEEHNKFYTGLFKLPIMPYLINKESKEIILNYEDTYNLLINNENYDENLKCIINPMHKNCDNIMVHKNDYYTLHCKYLNGIKEHFSNNVDIISDINKYMKCLSNGYLNAEKKNNNNRSYIKLHDVISFLDRKRNKQNPTKPIVLILRACTMKEDYEYLQNSILKNSDNNNNNNNNNYKVNNYKYNHDRNERIQSIDNFIEYINRNINLENENIINIINDQAKELILRVIRNVNYKNNNNYNYIFNFYNKIIIDNFNEMGESPYEIIFKYNYYNETPIKNIINILVQNIFKYYLLLLLIIGNHIKKIQHYRNHYIDNFDNFNFFSDIFSKVIYEEEKFNISSLFEQNNNVNNLNNSKTSNTKNINIKYNYNNNNEAYIKIEFMKNYNKYFINQR